MLCFKMNTGKFMFKRIFVFLFAYSVCYSSSAQPSQYIAPFKITLTNGKMFTYQDLKKNTPTVLVYFSPTCDHCKHFMDALLRNESQLKNKQIILITYQSVNEIKAFDQPYNVASKPYFKIGTEGLTFIVQKYYNIQKFPYIVLYDKQLKMVKKLSPTDDPAALAKEVSGFNPH